MAARIVEALSISSAAGWWMSDDEGASFQPITCWVLAVSVDDQFETLSPDKIIVGITVLELDSIPGIEYRQRRYFHETEFETIGEELK